MFNSNTFMDGGSVRLMAVSTTSVTVRVVFANNYDFSDAVYRMGFRFYFERLTFSGSCSVASVYSNQHGWNGNAWCQQGGCSNKCEIGDRMFFIGFSLYRDAYYQRQWPYWSAGYYYDFVINFGSVGQDSNNNAN
jgi:hypothetical protein